MTSNLEQVAVLRMPPVPGIVLVGRARVFMEGDGECPAVNDAAMVEATVDGDECEWRFVVALDGERE